MHSQFSEWFRAAKIPQEDAVLQKRWAAAQAFDVERSGVVALIELFFGDFGNKEEFLGGFRDAFQKADASFRMRGNNLELSVLAGATLIALITDADQALSDLVTVGLVSYAAQNLRKAPCVTEIPEIAAKHLNKRTTARSVLTEEDTEELDESQIEIKQLRRDLDLLSEEVNILWWVFGESSRDSNLRWSSYSVSEIAVMAGKELADLVKLSPGPASAGAILDKIIKTAKPKTVQLEVKDAIQKLSPTWKPKFLHGRVAEIKNLTPITFAVQQSLDLAEEDGWIQTLSTVTKLQQSRKIEPHLLAYQIYLERLLADLWKKSE